MIPSHILPDSSPGSAANFRVGIGSMQLSAGSAVNIPVPGVTAIVGANNVGKSTLLRELHSGLVGTFEQSKVLKSIDLIHDGTSADAIDWMTKHCYVESRPGRSLGFALPGVDTEVIPVDHAIAIWERGHKQTGIPTLGNLVRLLALFADAGSRQQFVNAYSQRQDFGDPPQHPLHTLQDDPQLMATLSELCSSVFGTPLTLDTLSGQIGLRVGSVDVEPPRVDNITPEYREAMANLPRLQEQGDGMRSLLGLLIPILCGSYRIIIVDEPEAFLHPPQAVALGTALATLAKQREIQIILATHDKNLLAGLLASDAEVSVVKLDRAGTTNEPHQLVNSQLRSLWSDPILRYTNALDGLFHKLVVLMEGDQDCKFLAAAFEHAELPLPASEVLFLPTSGKASLFKIASSLHAIDVPTIASPDLDIFNDATVMQNLVESLGGEWQEYNKAYREATESFRAPRQAVTASQVHAAIAAILTPMGDAEFDNDAKKDVSAAMRIGDSPWKALKEYGISAFKGTSRKTVEDLLTSLSKIGLVPLREGELENLAPSVGVRKGSGWLPAALDAGAHKEALAQAHVSAILGSFTSLSATREST